MLKQDYSSETRHLLREAILYTQEPAEFDELALKIFHYQYKHNGLYRRYCSMIDQDYRNISSVRDIPFFPIQFFKNYDVRTGKWKKETTFLSSGTTGGSAGKHPVRSLEFYRAGARRTFQRFYGAIKDYCFLCLLPSYMERSGSSLICMAEDFIRVSEQPDAGFFLHDTERLESIIRKNQALRIPTVLIGVSFALLDLAEQYDLDMHGMIIMETGGMKGRRRELTRDELHATLCSAFNVDHIHSEYGMTELFSQAYAKKGGLFHPAPTLRALVRETTNPLEMIKTSGKTGALNLIDLANIDTCSFIATDDLGKVNADGSFEVLGRLDQSDARGCNLLVDQSV